MRRTLLSCIALLLAAAPASAEEPAVGPAARADEIARTTERKIEEKKAEEKAEEKKSQETSDTKKKDDEKGAKGKAAKNSDDGDKLLSGMSIVGNDEAPKSLVIVPWKSSELGHSLDLSKDLDDGRGPVDKDVFLRELAYYRIRSASGGTDEPDSQ